MDQEHLVFYHEAVGLKTVALLAAGALSVAAVVVLIVWYLRKDDQR